MFDGLGHSLAVIICIQKYKVNMKYIVFFFKYQNDSSIYTIYPEKHIKKHPSDSFVV